MLFWKKQKKKERVRWAITGLDLYRCLIEDEPAVVVVNLDFGAQAPLKDYRHFLSIILDLQLPGSKGLATEDEVVILGQLEDFLVELLQKTIAAIFVGRVTTDGQRKFYFYARQRNIPQNVIQLILQEFPAYRFSGGTHEDPEWEQYFNCLYPNEIAYQYIITSRVLADIPAATLARLGSTAITHYIYFDTLQQRDDCAAQLLRRGLTVLPEAQHLSEIGIFRVRVSQHDAISHNAIYDMIEQIIVVTQKFGITYSHWELDDEEILYTHVSNDVKLHVATEITAEVRSEVASRQFGISFGETITGEEAMKKFLLDLK